MTIDAVEHPLPETISDEDTVIIELSLEDIASIAGGPQVTNDGIMPPLLSD
ncbi:hypothetical protein [Roseateles depolymerans]|uniref:Uncharacterized protein n=1 Tax=Roseateles depolymerans TaxID=76731 RepID=A0A0U3N8F0_9BURK|nr:hypothetical protein [Roseateles depolymerans]ALV04832.1 hypothetical protein RD2015_329 [Roseateles depolymerans]REG15156.1 hypothetical protein DES44_3662 [Roseateles depolymerans]